MIANINVATYDDVSAEQVSLLKLFNTCNLIEHLLAPNGPVLHEVILHDSVVHLMYNRASLLSALTKLKQASQIELLDELFMDVPNGPKLLADYKLEGLTTLSDDEDVANA